jgi:hypothetical protein
VKRKLKREDLIAMRRQHDEWDQAKEKDREEAKVEFLLQQLMMPKRKKVLLDTSEQRTGHRRLTLDLFNEMCPTFPLLMAFAPVKQVDKLHTDNKATLPALMKRFMDAPFIKPYEEWYEQAEKKANGRAIALLFNRKGIQQGCVLHDNQGLDAYWRPGTHVIHQGGTREEPAVIHMESFSALVKAVHDKGKGWKPEFAF